VNSLFLFWYNQNNSFLSNFNNLPSSSSSIFSSLPVNNNINNNKLIEFFEEDNSNLPNNNFSSSSSSFSSSSSSIPLFSLPDNNDNIIEIDTSEYLPPSSPLFSSLSLLSFIIPSKRKREKLINFNAFDNLDDLSFPNVIFQLISSRKDQDMKGDCNCGYYGIIFQVHPDRFGGNILGGGREISLEAKNIVNNLRKIVLEYNNTQSNNHGILSSDNYKIEENDWL
jgi:hypothetical protein